jgi:predicted Zn-dependent peptidase
LVASALRNGGAGTLTPEAFDWALENQAASMDSESETEDFSASFKCLSKNLPDILNLFGDMILKPKFDPVRFETDKADTIDSLNRIEDTPDALTRVLFYKSLMAHSPYGRWGSPKSLAGITRDDLLKFYEENYGPRGSVLAVAGHFDEEQVTAQLEKIFSGWKNQAAQPAHQDATPLGPTIYFFPKDVTQVFIRWGVPGIKRHDPKDIPLDVANYILGGSGFGSHLMNEIRSNRGLAYFVDSVSQPLNISGIFEVVGGTRPDSVKEYLDVMFQQLDEFAKQGPTEKELANAKQSMIEEYAYNFESPYDLLDYKASLDFRGYPDDYLSTYRNQVKAVTRDQAAEAAQSVLSQKNWVLVICGPAELESELSTFGKVVKVTSVFDPLEKP